MKTVITYGTFDLFHVGHARLLRRLRALGDRLVVGCSTDEFNDIKGKRCIFGFEDRREILASCRHVDEVFPERNWEQKAGDIRRFEADILAMGDDWSGKFDYLAEETGCVITYLPRTPGISATAVKDVLRTIRTEDVDAVINIIESLREQVARLGK